MTDPGTTPNDGPDTEGFRDDDVDTEHTGPYEVDDREEALETVTNDAVGGETVEPQPGDGTASGPTGGAEREEARTCGSTRATRTTPTSGTTSAPSRSDRR